MDWPTVTVADIVNRWRPLTSSESTVADTMIRDAEADLRSKLRLRGLLQPPSHLSAELYEEWEQTYVSVIVASVKRALLNPDAIAEEREQLDDYGRTRRRDRSVATGEIYFTVQEISRLVPRRRTAFSIRLGRS